MDKGDNTLLPHVVQLPILGKEGHTSLELWAKSLPYIENNKNTLCIRLIGNATRQRIVFSLTLGNFIKRTDKIKVVHSGLLRTLYVVIPRMI